MKLGQVVCTLAVATVVVSSLPLVEEHTFETFKAAYGKSYASAEEHQRRQEIFAQNLVRISEHNANPQWTYTLGVNAFADMTSSEFASLYAKGIDHQANQELLGAAPTRDSTSDKHVDALPASLDWRDKNVVTPPKNQGGCGSCWAFSTAETLESHIAIKTGKLMEFSPQEFVSCAPNPNDCGGTGGCQGSIQPLGFKYAEEKGITAEKSYPYEGRTGTCDEKKIVSVATITGYEVLPTNNYTALMNAVAEQPIAISAAAEPWQLYSGGVYNGHCGTDVDHAIQLVGYGTAGNKTANRQLLGGGGGGGGDYWLVRNSWGASWGEKGYIRIKRMGDGKEPCAMDNTPADGYACTKPTPPKPLEVCGVCGILSASSYPTGGKLV